MVLLHERRERLEHLLPRYFRVAEQERAFVRDPLDIIHYRLDPLAVLEDIPSVYQLLQRDAMPRPRAYLFKLLCNPRNQPLRVPRNSRVSQEEPHTLEPPNPLHLALPPSMVSRKRERATVNAHRIVHPTRVAMHHLFRYKRPLVDLIRGRGRDCASALVGDVGRGCRGRHAVRV